VQIEQLRTLLNPQFQFDTAMFMIGIGFGRFNGA